MVLTMLIVHYRFGVASIIHNSTYKQVVTSLPLAAKHASKLDLANGPALVRTHQLHTDN